MNTVNMLLKLHIGDEGRLLYLRNALKNGKVIFNSDKIFLQRMQEKLDQMHKNQPRSTNISPTRLVTQKRLSEYNLHNANFTNRVHDLAQSSEERKNERKIENQKPIPGLEKLLLGMTDSIEELKNTQSKILTNLEIMVNDYKDNIMHNPVFNEIITDYLIKKNAKNEFAKKNDLKFKEFPKNNLFSNKVRTSRNIKISDIMAWCTSGLFIVWFASFLNLIDINPFQNVLLGLSVGLAICVGIIHKIQKK